MLYASRNPQGKIISLSETPSSGTEAVDINDADVRAFLSLSDEGFAPDSYLHESDVAIARIVEDLIELLVARNLIIFTDLPDAAQRKLLSRKLARTLISKENNDAPDQDSSFLADDSALI